MVVVFGIVLLVFIVLCDDRVVARFNHNVSIHKNISKWTITTLHLRIYTIKKEIFGQSFFMV